MEMNYRRPEAGRPCADCHSTGKQVGFLRPDRLDPDPAPWSGLEHPWWLDREASADSVRGDGDTSR